MLRACAALANGPACAERIAVSPSPRMETATRISRREKPREWRGCFMSEPRVPALRLLAVVARPQHGDLALPDVRLARERRDEDREHVGIERGSRDAELDRGPLRLPAGPEVEV